MGNKYIDSEAPWKLAKAGETDKLDSVLYILVEVMRRVGILLGPLVPNSSKNLLDQAGVPENMRSFESLKDRVEPGSKMQPPSPIFPKIEVSK
jgi:methionyl-tRNA synthetase